MKKIELLAPAKDIDSGKAAILYGADAVYIGAPKFGARAAAGNSFEDIKSLIDFAHKFYARVYITLNTILYDDELNEVKEIIHALYHLGVDAIIIQDMGILEMDLPPIPLFASTQTNNYTWQKVKFLEDAGIQRVILARELSMEQILEIRKNTKVDLEFFVHGALCVSFSGQCYFSHSIDKGSANRGTCAQPCRAYYSLLDKNGNVITKNKYLLSLKDLNLSDYIGEMIDIGITSFKIEGRLKDINYIKNTTAHFRKQIDDALKTRKDFFRSSSGTQMIDFEPDPEKTFNRGFTNYFYKGRNKDISSSETQKSIGKQIGKVKAVMGDSFTIESSTNLNNGDGICFFDDLSGLQGMLVNQVDGNRIYCDNAKNLKPGATIYRNYDQDFNKKLSASKSNRKISVTIKIEEYDKGITIKASDEDHNKVIFNTEITKEIAQNTEKALESIIEQFKKSGDSIFTITDVHIKFQNPLFFKISVLNELRRKTVELLEKERLINYPKEENALVKTNHPYPEKFLDYKGNVLNRKAISFYDRHGVKMIENAFEVESDFTNKEIMITKHCIKYQMGFCPKFDKPGNKKLNEPLYLADNNRKYKLEFDCKQCAMKVIFLH